MIACVLLYPLVQTVVYSFMNSSGKKFVGLKNYTELFGDPDFKDILINNALWVLIVPAGTVVIGLLIATLSNQIGPRREKFFKSLIFMPMAISFVSAATIWRFMYVYVAPGRPEIGLFNAVLSAMGFSTQPWLNINHHHLAASRIFNGDDFIGNQGSSRRNH